MATIDKDLLAIFGDVSGEDLAKHWGLTPAEYAALTQMPAFTEMVRRATEELASPDGLAEKIRRKAALAVESGMVDVVSIMVNPQASASLRLNAFAELKELAGLTKNATQQGAAGVSGPIIQINFGDHAPTKSITVGNVIEGSSE
jgi:hypothetical protein